MGAPDLIARLSALGLRLAREGDGIRVAPRAALTDEARTLIREHKAELLAALPADAGNDPLPDAEAEARRQRVLAMLAERPGIRRAVYCDGRTVNGIVILTVGILHAGRIVTVDMEIPAGKYDGVRLLDLVARHSGTMH